MGAMKEVNITHAAALVVLGPTSTGKTELALLLAKKFNGELIACDSRQVYKKLDIGTGKLPRSRVVVKKEVGHWEMDGIKIWMYDVADPKRQYTVFDFVKDVGKVAEQIIKRKKLVIIVGGTGFYLKALIKGLPSLVVPLDLKLRKNLEKLPLEKLQEKLQRLSPDKWGKMNYSDRQNPRRLIRAIEVAGGVGINIAGGGLMLTWDVLQVGLTAPREVLYQRIDERIVERMKQGMINEAKDLCSQGLTFKRMKQLGLEYGCLADYLKGQIRNEGELIKILQGKIHGYARRQITWFKKEKNISWFDITDSRFPAQVENLVTKWYHQLDDTQG